MDLSVFDKPAILQTMFFPRSARPYKIRSATGIIDGTITVAPDVELGYRFFLARPAFPVIIFFHGNGEIAADYNSIAGMFHQIGASFLVIDFRGYGWSTGTPTFTSLLGDVEPVVSALPQIVEDAKLEPSHYYVMGRSMGSAPAIQMASNHSSMFAGLIIESGFAKVMPLLARRGLAHILDGIPDPIGNEEKIKMLDLPLLVIHGERDNLIPVEQGQMLYDASPAETKRIWRAPQAGHNDLLLYVDEYFDQIRQFLNRTS